MDELERCQRQLSDPKDIIRTLAWAARTVVRETVVGMVPAREQSLGMLAEALRDPRIADLVR